MLNSVAVTKAISESLHESVQVKVEMLETQLSVLVHMTEVIVSAFTQGRKVLLFGNGGSAADSQHIAAEFIGRFLLERSPLPAIALSTDTSILTALSNDYSSDIVFSRQVSALGMPGDVAIALSTSGNSKNVLNAVRIARDKGMMTLGLTGRSGGQLSDLCDYVLKVPSTKTARIQECHITACHAICEIVEASLFNPNNGSS